MRYRPCVPDNVRHWRVFEDEIEIKKLLELTDEFTNAQIDQEEDEGDEQLMNLLKMNLLKISLLNMR